MNEKLQSQAENLYRYGEFLDVVEYKDGEELPHRLTIIYYEQGVYVVHKCCGIVREVIKLKEGAE